MSSAITEQKGQLQGKRRIPGKIRFRRMLESIANHSVLISLSVIFILPFYLIVVISLMSYNQASLRELWPNPFVWHNYVEVFTAVPYLHWMGNTFLISITTAVGTVVSSVPPAYVLARLRWRGRNGLFILILATMMLPGQVTMIPVYIIFAKLGWIPSFLPLTVPAFFADAFSIFLLRQFFMTIPDELSDAARIDGCSEFQLMRMILIPLAKPAIMAIALFSFLGSWNDFFGPLLYLVEDPNLWTLGIGLTQFEGIHHVDRNLLMTASAIFMMPIIILFFFSQRVFIEGVTLTGVKE